MSLLLFLLLLVLLLSVIRDAGDDTIGNAENFAIAPAVVIGCIYVAL